MKRFSFTLSNAISFLALVGVGLCVALNSMMPTVINSVGTNETPGVYVEHSMLLQGTELYVVRVEAGRLRRTSKWQNDNTEPDVGIKDAIFLASKGATTMEPLRKANLQLRFDSVELIRFEANVWYWLVHFTQQTAKGNDSFEAGFSVIVLLDGTVVVPVPELKG